MKDFPSLDQTPHLRSDLVVVAPDSEAGDDKVATHFNITQATLRGLQVLCNALTLVDRQPIANSGKSSLRELTMDIRKELGAVGDKDEDEGGDDFIAPSDEEEEEEEEILDDDDEDDFIPPIEEDEDEEEEEILDDNDENEAPQSKKRQITADGDADDDSVSGSVINEVTQPLVFPISSGASYDYPLGELFWKSTNLTAVFDRLSNRLSVELRSSVDLAGGIKGTTHLYQLHFKIRWGFLTLPFLSLAVGWAYFALVTLQTRRLGIPVFKESVLPTLT
ncbi:hypothetical protein IMZ48_13555 [Candidatus Bathyarchaeota archaeon]|nr:hypothetical protein [Candidatus Bathyarchaeota archaeon]